MSDTAWAECANSFFRLFMKILISQISVGSTEQKQPP